MNKKLKTIFIVAGIGLVVLLGWFWLGSGNGEDQEIITVGRRDLAETVAIAGRVEAEAISNLGFDVSGIVRQVKVRTNDKVVAGQTLAVLDLGTLPAELRAAQAQLQIKQAERGNTATNLEAVRATHDTLVANAYATLLSEGLEAEPQSATQTETPPTITGRYLGPEGQYKIRVVQSTQTGQNPLVRVFELESAPEVELSDSGTAPLGTRGLYLTFANPAADYEDTTWYVDVPNTRATEYTANFNAYDAARRERAEAIETAEAELRGQTAGSSIREAELAAAQAEVDQIQAEINKRILRAPFAGLVTAITVDPGEALSGSATALTLLTDDKLGVEIDLPEVDVVKVEPGDTATIRLEALTSETSFAGRVATVDRSETLVDGVPVYEARIIFDELDPRIASGMMAEVEITTAARATVVAVPARAVRRSETGQTTVIVVTGNKGSPRPVTTGLASTDGFVEVTAGLNEGDRILVPAASS